MFEDEMWDEVFAYGDWEESILNPEEEKRCWRFEQGWEQGFQDFKNHFSCKYKGDGSDYVSVDYASGYYGGYSFAANGGAC